MSVQACLEFYRETNSSQMCQLTERVSTDIRRKSRMKENPEKGSQRRCMHNDAFNKENQRSYVKRDPKALKRQRQNGTSPIQDISTNCARYTAYKCVDSTEYPSSPNGSINGTVAQAKRHDNCSSPPAKTPVVTQLVYAGAKFHDPPAPKQLPKPPSHWFVRNDAKTAVSTSCSEMTNILKVMLKVPSPVQDIAVHS